MPRRLRAARQVGRGWAGPACGRGSAVSRRLSGHARPLHVWPERGAASPDLGGALRGGAKPHAVRLVQAPVLRPSPDLLLHPGEAHPVRGAPEPQRWGCIEGSPLLGAWGSPHERLCGTWGPGAEQGCVASARRGGSGATHCLGNGAKAEASGRRDFASTARRARVADSVPGSPGCDTMANGAALGSPARPAVCCGEPEPAQGLWPVPKIQHPAWGWHRAAWRATAPNLATWPSLAMAAPLRAPRARVQGDGALAPQLGRVCASAMGPRGAGERGACRERCEDSLDGFAASSRTQTSPGRPGSAATAQQRRLGGGAAASHRRGGRGDPPRPEVMSTACSSPAGKGGAALLRPAWWAEQAAPCLGLTGVHPPRVQQGVGSGLGLLQVPAPLHPVGAVGCQAWGWVHFTPQQTLHCPLVCPPPTGSQGAAPSLHIP